MAEKDYYEVLEVHPNAGWEMIKNAYRFLAVKYHPDRHDPAKKEWAHRKFIEISEAYQVLSDSAARRDYDRVGRNIETGKPSEGRVDEEAYFYYRIGLEHYEEAKRGGTLRILFGRCRRYLKFAMDDFATVLDDYPASKYSEDAHYYYIRTLMEGYEYGEEFLKETEEEFDEFLNEFPRSKWAKEVKMQFAKFYLFKKRDSSKAKRLLSDIIQLYPNADLAREAEILLEYMGREKVM